MSKFKLSILDKYILKQIAEIFIFGVLIFTSIIFASDTFTTVIKQISLYGMPVKIAFMLILLNLPAVMVMTIPISVLFATVMTVNRMCLASELTVSLSEVEDFISDNDDMYTEIEIKELGRVISNFVRSLSDRRMYIFMSRYYVARPIKEIAILLKCSESTVHKEIAAIKHDLKEKLEKEGYTL